ncbi:MAG: hypothetical protein WAQ05_02470 [Rubrivivax sp.]
MNQSQLRRHRSASKGAVVARAAVVLGLAAGIGLLLSDAAPATSWFDEPDTLSGCPASGAWAPLAAL